MDTEGKGRFFSVKHTKTNILAEVFHTVFHSIIINAVEWSAVFQQGFLHAVNMDADYQAHLGFEICKNITAEVRRLLQHI